MPTLNSDHRPQSTRRILCAAILVALVCAFAAISVWALLHHTPNQPTLASIRGLSLSTLLAKDTRISSSDPRLQLVDILRPEERSAIVFIRSGCPHCESMQLQLDAVPQNTALPVTYIYVTQPHEKTRTPKFIVGDLIAHRLGIHATPTVLLLNRAATIDAVYVGDDPSVLHRILEYLVPTATNTPSGNSSTEVPCAACAVP